MNMNGMNMDFQQMQSPQNGMYDASFIDPSAIANPQMNGARSYPMSSVPQKRDSTGAALSRSQTPSQQPQFGFQQGFSHTPSPTLQNQHFRQGSLVPQRLQSPAQNPQAQQMSAMGFNPGAPMSQGFDPPAGAQFAGVQLSQNLQQRQQEAQRRFMQQQQQQQQQQQVQQLQQQQLQRQQQQQMANMGNVAGGNMVTQQGMAGQIPGMGMQQPGMQQPGMQRNMVPGQMTPAQIQQQREQQAAFIRNVAALYAQNNRKFNPQPVVANRPVNLGHLYRIVASNFKGSQVVNQTGQWPKVAQILGFDIRAFPSAPDELRRTYEENLSLYEEHYWKSRQAQQAQQAHQAAQAAQAAQMRSNAMQQQQPMTGMPSQMSPPRPSIPGAPSPAVNQEYIQSLQRSRLATQQQREQLQQAQAQPPFSPAMKQQQQYEQSTPVQSNATLAGVNGRSTPQTDAQPVGGTMDPQHRKSMSRQLESIPAQTPPGAPAATPAPVIERELPTNMVEGKVVYRPSWRVIDRWSGLDFEAERLKKRVDELVHYQPNLPNLPEMGVIDIRALTMSIRSGLHAETRLALDVLVKLTHELTIELQKSEDLIDVLVEFGEDQLEILANNNPEVSDIIDLTPYEDVIHNCNAEIYSLQQHAEFGSKEFDLDRTADRILALTTILRNLSFHEVNHAHLTTTPVLKFLANAIRLVGTRVLLLRTHMRTFDFMKDVVTFFSNTSTKISLPSRDDAYAILHFLCAFAPTPRPSTPVNFTAYNPRVHKCLPSAVDSLAKLLARDDPNRTFCKQIFASEATSTPPYDLLTRAFGLAIAVVPDRTSGLLHQVIETEVSKSRHVEARIAEIRKPYLMQGMLAADILATLAPGSETGLCQSWLESEDGWANCLIKFVMNLCAVDGMRDQHPQQQPQGRGVRPVQVDREDVGYTLLVQRALSMMKKLGEKSRGVDVPVKGGPGAQVNGHAEAHRRRERDVDMDLDDSDSDDGDDDDDDDDDLPSDDEYDGGSRMRKLQVGGSVWRVKTNFLPWKETLLSALLTPTLDERSLKQFCGIGYLDELR